MTHTDEGSRSNPSILANGTLSLHRETLEHLTGGTERHSRRRASATGGSLQIPCNTATCRGRTCNRNCLTANCSGSIY